ncbi:MAG: methyltransferase domain-containing protein [Elusimicrobia bacterium]|nr:methyltransferase domain-containing protein [Elusimicrobiota bacterium]
MRNWWTSFFKVYPLAEAVPARNTKQEVRFILRALKLRRGQKVLDLGCGVGRHSILLAAKGLRVTGLDATARYLREARRRANGHRVKWVKSDMRRIPFKSEFDSVISMFTSFGYFSSIQEDLRVLKGICRALKPGGTLFLDVFNGERVRRNLKPQSWEEWGKGQFVLRSDRFQGDGVSTGWIFVDSRSRIRRGNSFTRMYNKGSISKLFKRAGFLTQRLWGDFDGRPYTPHTRRLMVLAKKR